MLMKTGKMKNVDCSRCNTLEFHSICKSNPGGHASHCTIKDYFLRAFLFVCLFVCLVGWLVGWLVGLFVLFACFVVLFVFNNIYSGHSIHVT